MCAARWTSCRTTGTTCLADGGRLLPHLTDDEIDAALERGRAARMGQPRIAAARVDHAGAHGGGAHGRLYGPVPARSLQGLETASDDNIAAVEIRGSSSGLRWGIGGADHTIAGLLAGRSETKAFMEAGSQEASARERGGPALELGQPLLRHCSVGSACIGAAS